MKTHGRGDDDDGRNNDDNDDSDDDHDDDETECVVTRGWVVTVVEDILECC